jgi:hypothetical protein
MAAAQTMTEKKKKKTTTKEIRSVTEIMPVVLSSIKAWRTHQGSARRHP